MATWRFTFPTIRLGSPYFTGTTGQHQSTRDLIRGTHRTRFGWLRLLSLRVWVRRYAETMARVMICRQVRSLMPNENHWTERGRATSVGNADALGRPRRSVRSFVAT